MAKIDADIASQGEARLAAAATVPADLLTRYERLRATLAGTGAARLVGGSCSGCHLTLPAMEVDRIRKAPPDEVITCDQCGRILVR
jgi:predicted  nucleic acid-binding Zn-ribbon protein